MESIGNLTKESLVMTYSKLPRENLLQAMAGDISKHISAVAAYTWFLHQGLESEKWSVDEKKDFTEQILKASVAISAVIEAGREVESMNHKNADSNKSDNGALKEISDALREMAERLDTLSG
jgi:hypothetical protein